MPYTYCKLRGRIYEKFGTITAFSNALNTTKQAVSRKLRGGVSFTQKDIMEWSELLEIDKQDYGLYFFA